MNLLHLKENVKGKWTFNILFIKLFINLPECGNYLSSYMKLKPTKSFSPKMEKNIFGLDEYKEIVNT